MREQGALENLKEVGLTVQTGQEITFYLAENPTTGHSWQLDKKSSKGLWTAEEEY